MHWSVCFPVLEDSGYAFSRSIGHVAVQLRSKTTLPRRGGPSIVQFIRVYAFVIAHNPRWPAAWHADPRRTAWVIVRIPFLTIYGRCVLYTGRQDAAGQDRERPVADRGKTLGFHQPRKCGGGTR